MIEAFKCLLKIQELAPTQAFLSREHFTLSRKMPLADSVELLSQEPNCPGGRRE